MSRFAKGKQALALCQRSGRKMLYLDTVFDGVYPNMRVDPAWYEGKHPQENIFRVDDPVTLYRPAPPNFRTEAPVLDAVISGQNINVSWTEASSDEGIVLSYTLYRALNDGDFIEVGTFPVVRAWDGKVTSMPLSYTQVGYVSGTTYRFYVVANGGIFSLASNIDEVTPVFVSQPVQYVAGSAAFIDPGLPTAFTNPLTIDWTQFPISSPLLNAVAVISFAAITLSPTGPTSVTFAGINANLQHHISPRQPNVIPGPATEYLHIVNAIVPLQSVNTTTLPNRNVVITWPSAATYFVEGTMLAFVNVSTASNNFGSGTQSFDGTLDLLDLPLAAPLNVPAGSAVVAIGAVNTGDDVEPDFLTNTARTSSLPTDFLFPSGKTINLAGGYASTVAYRLYSSAVPSEILWMSPGQVSVEAGFGRVFVLAQA
jgi:hypothetical protein